MTHEEIEAATERLNILDDGNHSYSMRDVARALIGEDSVPIRFSHTIAYLLQQADPDTHMELPKDADGVPIHVGDELCGYGYPNGGVYCKAIINGWGVAVGTPIDTDTSGWRLWNVSDIHHYHKPTVEEILREMIDKAGCRHYPDGSCEMGLSHEQIADYAKRISEAMAV